MLFFAGTENSASPRRDQSIIVVRGGVDAKRTHNISTSRGNRRSPKQAASGTDYAADDPAANDDQRGSRPRSPAEIPHAAERYGGKTTRDTATQGPGQ